MTKVMKPKKPATKVAAKAAAPAKKAVKPTKKVAAPEEPVLKKTKVAKTVKQIIKDVADRQDSYLKERANIKNGETIDIDLSTVANLEYLEYGTAVIEDRAIFSGIDGLKPVSRRSLYAIHQLGLNNKAKADKSAKAVGATLGNYHPHGDSACLHGSTMIPFIDESPKTIASLAQSNAGPRKVIAFDEVLQKFVQAEAWGWRETKQVTEFLQVILSSGECLQLTSDHKVLKNTGWVEAGGLYVGDEIIGGTIQFGLNPVLVSKFGSSNIDDISTTAFPKLGYTKIQNTQDCRFPASEHNKVVAIRKVKLDEPIPVYDFSVDTHHNMIVYTSDGEKSGNFSVVHNCYEAMVTAASKVNIPMIEGEGNWGTMTEGAAAMRYCFTKDTKVLTEDGLVDFETLAKRAGVYQKTGEADFTVKILGSDTWENTSHVVCSGKQDIVEVVAGPHRVTCTPNEPFMVLTKLGYRWKEAQFLDNSDYVCFPRNELEKEGLDFNLNQTYALLGIILGAEAKITGNNFSMELSEDACLRFFDLLPTTYYAEVEFTANAKKFAGQTTYSITTTSEKLAKGLDSFGIKKVAARRGLPPALFGTDKRYLPTFLTSYFDTAACLLNVANDTSTILIPAIAEKLGQDICLVLANYFKIYVSKTFNTRLQISGYTNLREFSQFGTKFLDQIVFVPDDGDTIPNCEAFGIPNFEQDQLRSDFLQICKTKPSLGAMAKSAQRRDYHYERVTAVLEKGKDWVYDLTVPNQKSFIANGFVVHNTNLKLSKYSDAIFFDKFYLPTIDWVPNYDGSTVEPLVLPALLPNAIINGNFGMAPGVNTRSPMFGLQSVMDVIQETLDAGGICTPEICMGLEFTTYGGGKAVRNKSNRETFLDFFKTGKGKVQFESTATTISKTNSIRFNLFAPISDMTKAMTKIESIKGVQHTSDDSEKSDPFKTAFVVTFVKSLKGDALDAAISEVHAVLKSNYTYDVKVTDRLVKPDGTAGAKLRSTNIPTIINDWLAFRIGIEKKACAHWTKENEKIIAYQELMRLAIANLDLIIKHVKNKKLTDEALLKALAKDLKITTEQANQILARNLRQLRHLEDSKLSEVIKTAQAEIKSLSKRSKNPTSYIKEHLKVLQKTLI